MGKEGDITVWGAAGGQGTTTVAAALSALSGSRFVSLDPMSAHWILGSGRKPANDSTVCDAGVLQLDSERVGTNVVVVRGPCLLVLRRLSVVVDARDHLVVVSEPWRTLPSSQVEDALGLRVVAEVPFSERIARQVDAGVLGARIERLIEFESLSSWLRILKRPSQPSA